MNLDCSITLYCNRKLHYRTVFQGIPISVENRKGSIRQGCDKKWGCWKVRMKIPYGYVRSKHAMGKDGQFLDVFIGPKVDAKFAYVIMIMKQPDFKKTDEEKVMLGFASGANAKKAFLEHYDDSRFFGSMKKVSMEEFRKIVSGELAAELGEPNVYDGGYGHIEPRSTFHPSSLKKAKRVPVDNPGESDDSYGDVTRRKAAATKARRDSLTRQHTDSGMRPLSSTAVVGFPSGTVGGFG